MIFFKEKKLNDSLESTVMIPVRSEQMRTYFMIATYRCFAFCIHLQVSQKFVT